MANTQLANFRFSDPRMTAADHEHLRQKQMTAEDRGDGKCFELSWNSFLQLRKNPANVLYYVSCLSPNVYGKEIVHFVVEHGDEVVDHTLPRALEIAGHQPQTRMPKEVFYPLFNAHAIIKLNRDQFQAFLDIAATYREHGRPILSLVETRKLMSDIRKKWRSKDSVVKNIKREFRFRFGGSFRSA